jgi:hypothetical protein
MLIVGIGAIIAWLKAWDFGAPGSTRWQCFFVGIVLMGFEFCAIVGTIRNN